ncbi:MAG: aminoglycoside phosphotransferase family protein [Thermomicrobiales bacterium]
MPSRDCSPRVADPPLTADQRAAVVRRAWGPDAILGDATPVMGGTVNEVWRLTVRGIGEAILRVAPSPAAAASGPSWLTPDGLRREQAAIALLPRLAPILPRTIQFDDRRDLVDRDWVVQSIMPGQPWSDLVDELDAGAEQGLWRHLGAICRVVHAVHGPAFGPAQDPTFATWSDLLRDDARGLLADAARFGLDTAPFARLVALVEAERAILDRITTPTLIHSDLGQRHCFIAPDADGQWRIVGLIDLEFARFADPLSESLLGELDAMPPTDPARVAFWRGYGPFATPPGAGRRAALYAAVGLGWTVTDLARLGSPVEAMPLLARLAERLAIAEARVAES